MFQTASVHGTAAEARRALLSMRSMLSLSLSVCLSLCLSLSLSLSHTHTHTHTHTAVDAFWANAALRGLLEARHYNGAGAHSSQVSAAVSLVLASPVCVFSDTKVW